MYAVDEGGGKGKVGAFAKGAVAGISAGVVDFVFEEDAGDFVGEVAGWVDGVVGGGQGDISWESTGLEGELECAYS